MGEIGDIDWTEEVDEIDAPDEEDAPDEIGVPDEEDASSGEPDDDEHYYPRRSHIHWSDARDIIARYNNDNGHFYDAETNNWYPAEFTHLHYMPEDLHANNCSDDHPSAHRCIICNLTEDELNKIPGYEGAKIERRYTSYTGLSIAHFCTKSCPPVECATCHIRASPIHFVMYDDKLSCVDCAANRENDNQEATYISHEYRWEDAPAFALIPWVYLPDNCCCVCKHFLGDLPGDMTLRVLVNDDPNHRRYACAVCYQTCILDFWDNN